MEKSNATDINTSTPLHDIELEKNVVGTMLQHCTISQIQEIRELLDADCFYDTGCRELFKLFCSMAERGEEVDPMTAYPAVMNSKTIELDAFTEILNYGFLNYTQCSQHLHILSEYSMRRKLWLIGHELINTGLTFDDGVEKIVEKIKQDCDSVVSGKSAEVVTMQDTLCEFNVLVNDNISGKNKGRKTRTGFDYLDDKGGLQSTDLIIIAGATSQGKTSLANSIVLNALNEGGRIAFYSLEMTRLQITSRMLSYYTKIYSNKMLTAPLLNEDLKTYNQGVGAIWDASSNLFFDDRSTSSIDSICNSIKKLKYKHDINGAVIDYIQLLSGQEKGQNKEQFMAYCARRLKNLAKELDIWIIALSQLNKDKENPMPSLDRVRDSGQIAEAADIVLMVYRPQYYNEVEGKNLSYPSPNSNVSVRGTAMIILEKGRNIGTGSFICGFDALTTHFYQMDIMPDKRDDEEIKKQEYVQSQLDLDSPF